MRDFLKDNYSILNDGVILFTVLVALLVFNKYKGTNVKNFLWFLIYVFFVDFLGGYPHYVSEYSFLKDVESALKGTLIERNFWWFNLFWKIGATVFFLSYFIRLIKNIKFRKVLIVVRLMFLIFSVSYLVFHIEELFNKTIVFNSIIASVAILFSAVLYFIDILKSDKVLTFYKSVNFYIASVIFIWYLVRTPIIFYDIYFNISDWDFVFLRNEIFLISNMFMYVTFSIALIWCKPQNS